MPRRCRDTVQTLDCTRLPTAGTRPAGTGAGTLSVLHEAGGALAGLLDTIDDGKLCQVIRLVETSGQRQTLEPAIADLRPRLRRLRPPRPLTLTRLLAVPLAPLLELQAGGASSYSIAREQLGSRLAQITAHIDPLVAETTRATIAGHSLDDEAIVVAAGRDLWPAAARALGNDPAAGEASSIAAERRRIADLFDIAAQLVPELARLPRVPASLDGAHRATIGTILALAARGPAERLGSIAALLLHRAAAPARLVDSLIGLAPPDLRPRLADLLQRLLAEQRAGLIRQLAGIGADPERALADTTDLLTRFADSVTVSSSATSARRLVHPAGGFALSVNLQKLCHEAATIAHAHYAAAIDRLLVPLPAIDAAERAAAVAAREATAQQIARLGRLVRRLSSATPIHEDTGAAIERLVDLQARRAGGDRSLVTADDARLIEILGGPDLGRRYLRPLHDRRASASTRSIEPESKVKPDRRQRR